eukprot:m.74594 g.74594  ORF g.74594 m.74594 type:complete len:303 (+) comp14519_c0_seq1:2287-3195(+)
MAEAGNTSLPNSPKSHLLRLSSIFSRHCRCTVRLHQAQRLECFVPTERLHCEQSVRSDWKMVTQWCTVGVWVLREVVRRVKVGLQTDSVRRSLWRQAWWMRMWQAAHFRLSLPRREILHLHRLHMPCLRASSGYQQCSMACADSSHAWRRSSESAQTCSVRLDAVFPPASAPPSPAGAEKEGRAEEISGSICAAEAATAAAAMLLEALLVAITVVCGKSTSQTAGGAYLMKEGLVGVPGALFFFSSRSCQLLLAAHPLHRFTHTHTHDSHTHAPRSTLSLPQQARLTDTTPTSQTKRGRFKL